MKFELELSEEAIRFLMRHFNMSREEISEFILRYFQAIFDNISLLYTLERSTKDGITLDDILILVHQVKGDMAQDRLKRKRELP